MDWEKAENHLKLMIAEYTAIGRMADELSGEALPKKITIIKRKKYWIVKKITKAVCNGQGKVKVLSVDSGGNQRAC